MRFRLCFVDDMDDVDGIGRARRGVQSPRSEEPGRRREAKMSRAKHPPTVQSCETENSFTFDS